MWPHHYCAYNYLLYNIIYYLRQSVVFKRQDVGEPRLPPAGHSNKKYMCKGTEAQWYLRNAHLHIDLRLPIIAQFIETGIGIVLRCFASHQSNSFVVAAANYVPLSDHHLHIRRYRRPRKARSRRRGRRASYFSVYSYRFSL